MSFRRPCKDGSPALRNNSAGMLRNYSAESLGFASVFGGFGRVTGRQVVLATTATIVASSGGWLL